MKKVLLFSCIAGFIIILIETAILSHLSFLNTIPDLLLIFVLYISIADGSVYGMVTGFTCGLFLDFLSLSPMGLHSFVLTILSFFVGKLHGRYNVNNFVLPCISVLSATFFKSFLFLFLKILFGNNIKVYNIFGAVFLTELGFNLLLTPFVFFFLGLFPSFFEIHGVRKNEF